MTDREWELLDAVPGWMGRAELEWLSERAARAASWTEVGVYCGRSLLAVGLALPVGTLLQAVDLAFNWGLATLAGLVGNWQDLNLDECRRWLPRNLAKIREGGVRVVTSGLTSVEAAAQLAPTEVVFLDADHRYENVKADIVAWKPKARILAGHDYSPCWEGVVKAVNELCPRAANPVGAIWVKE